MNTEPVALWRRLLIDIPAHITDVGARGFRWYFLAWLWLAATVGPLVTIVILVLYFGFGIRWGS